MEPPTYAPTKELSRIFSFMSFSFKKSVVRINESQASKEIRCHFLRLNLFYLYHPETYLVFFYWSNFFSRIFVKRGSRGSEKALATEVFLYSELHIFRVMSSHQLETSQFVKDTLRSPIFFSCLNNIMKNACQRNQEFGEDTWLIIDNSPLNHSREIKNRSRHMGFSILSTAPNSTFLNPIELLLAKIKSPPKNKS